MAARGDVPLGVFNPGIFKDGLRAQLARAEPGPPAVHIPERLRGPWPEYPRSLDPPHRWIEQLFAERRGADGRWHKVSTSARNEALDLMVMTHVMGHLHASRIDWRRPPAWAGEWHVNSMVRWPVAVAGTLAGAAARRPAGLAPAPLLVSQTPATVTVGAGQRASRFAGMA